jgi:glutamate/tyrosine decarboxylase-like PLP-dependent enzyme
MHLAHLPDPLWDRIDELLVQLRATEDRPILDFKNAFVGAAGGNSTWFSNLVQTAARATSSRTDPLGQLSRSLDPLENDFQRQENLIKGLAADLIQYSVPFSSDGYWAHMNWDTLMVSMAAIVATLPLNPNQVASEASPLTTALELAVGEQLCTLIGYQPDHEPAPFGHLTSDGSVANIEALWAARNLKLYPTAVAAAIRRDLRAARTVKVWWRESEVRLIDLSPWQLLNLSPQEALSLPARIGSCGVTEPEKAILKYTVQHLGISGFKKQFRKARVAKLEYLAPATAHYSLPKGSSLLGLGDVGLIRLPVDQAFRFDTERLDNALKERLSGRRPVVAVVAVIGNTEHGAVDPLEDIIDLRDKYRKKGLDFVVHADAAYGGYFAAMLRSATDTNPNDVLRPDTKKDLSAMARTDSVTVDPHKAGYVPYPAGAICYRDQRLPEMIAWRAPVVSHSGRYPTMGHTAIEGSRPGTAAAAVWIAHKAVPLNQAGYGSLLARSIVNSRTIREKLEAATVGRQFNITMLFGEKEQDLNILSYVFNIRGNKSPGIANKLNKCIFDRLAIEHKNDERPRVIITQSDVDPVTYTKGFVRRIRKRIGVNDDGSPLTFLITTIMNPFLAEDRMDRAIEEMFKVVQQEVKKLLNPPT